jgi:hypothetical protein
MALSIPVERLNTALGEYKVRRDTFREWLLRQLIEGVHYGIPPGCGVQSQVRNGVTWYKGPGQDNWYPETQWKPKPSLYKAGADFVVDLMGVRPQYEVDAEAWRQAGEIKGMFCIKCGLVSRATKELLGEGLGIGQSGVKKRDHNGAIKIAKKSAKIAAVIDTYSLSDLFTQDEPPPPPEHGQPERNHQAPKAAPRGEPQPEPEVSLAEFKAFGADWKQYRVATGMATTNAEWHRWLHAVGGLPEDRVKDYRLWTKTEFDTLCKQFDAEAPGFRGVERKPEPKDGLFT